MKVRVTYTIQPGAEILLRAIAEKEGRSKSNMIEQLILKAHRELQQELEKPKVG